jgi:hypothetical protein
MGDAVRDRPGLARARTREDADRAGRGDDRRHLLVI